MNRAVIAGFGLALALGAACGSPSTSDKPSNAGGQQAAGEPPVVATSAASPKPKGPWATFADGTYEVGTADGQVAPGKYKSTVPADSIGCYYARLKDTSGDPDSILHNDLANKGEPVIVTIQAKDGAFKTQGCGTWAKA